MPAVVTGGSSLNYTSSSIISSIGEYTGIPEIISSSLSTVASSSISSSSSSSSSSLSSLSSSSSSSSSSSPLSSPSSILSVPFSSSSPAISSSFGPPIRDLVSSQQQYIYQESSSRPFEIFEDDDLFGSPMPFDASENGLWNGKFVPPPPRPPFLDESIITDGVTTCDLCSWAMPTKSTFIFEGTIEKASELGWPLTLIIVSVLSAILGAILMVVIVRCKRKKSANRNETHVQWWSRNKRTNSQLRRSNIYTAHPADSIRGLQNNADTCNWSNVTTIVVTS